MNSKSVLKIIALISGFGLLFSGYLSYSEIFAQTCAIGGCTNIMSIPACVYGFVMYSIIFVLTIVGLKSKQ
jgi:hypothetical protein